MKLVEIRWSSKLGSILNEDFFTCLLVVLDCDWFGVFVLERTMLNEVRKTGDKFEF